MKKILSRIYIEKIMKIHIIETNEIGPKWSSRKFITLKRTEVNK